MFKSEFKRNVFTLTVGTAIAQVIAVAASPVLTRLYSPEDFGVFAIFMAISGILATIATGKYEIAIVLPEKDEDAVNIVALSVLITFSTCFLFGLIFLFFNGPITELADNEKISNWLYFIPLNVLFTCLFVILCNWLTRNKRFRGLALSKIIKSAIVVSLSVVLGIAKLGAAGLIIGALSGAFLVAMLLSIQIWLKDCTKRKLITKKRMIEQAKKYNDFPKFTVFSQLINVLANQLPILLFGIYFSTTVAGFYVLTQRVLDVPISLISNSISEVFKQRASNDYTKYGNCRRIFLKTLKSLALLSFIPFSILFFTAPGLFALVFGEEWREAGVYTQILSPYFFLKFIGNPLSFMFFIADKQKLNIIGQSILLFGFIISIYFGIYFENTKLSIISISITYSLFWIIYMFLSYKFSRRNM